MDIAELRKLRPALGRFVRQFNDFIKSTPSRSHLRTYLNGQLGPLERKSIEYIALDAVVPPRNLQGIPILEWSSGVHSEFSNVVLGRICNDRKFSKL